MCCVFMFDVAFACVVLFVYLCLIRLVLCLCCFVLRLFGVVNNGLICCCKCLRLLCLFDMFVRYVLYIRLVLYLL